MGPCCLIGQYTLSPEPSLGQVISWERREGGVGERGGKTQTQSVVKKKRELIMRHSIERGTPQ